MKVTLWNVSAATIWGANVPLDVVAGLKIYSGDVVGGWLMVGVLAALSFASAFAWLKSYEEIADRNGKRPC